VVVADTDLDLGTVIGSEHIAAADTSVDLDSAPGTGAVNTVIAVAADSGSKVDLAVALDCSQKEAATFSISNDLHSVFGMDQYQKPNKRKSEMRARVFSNVAQ